MDTIMAEIAAATGLDETTIANGGHVFVARRNEGDFRFQIFRDTEITPFGVVEAHRCRLAFRTWRLRTYGPNGRALGCMRNYLDALDQLALGSPVPRLVDG